MRILLVDDEPELLEQVGRMLRKQNYTEIGRASCRERV